jgi:tungstate transport system substrate-binding protein
LFLLIFVTLFFTSLTGCAAQTATAPSVKEIPASPSATIPVSNSAATEIPAVATKENTTTPAQHTNAEIILATTTSTRDSGLLEVLLPIFEKQSGYAVKMVAVGSGAALKMGEEGNADVILAHSPAAEKTYMDGGFGKDRYLVMHNDFIVVGPSSDPAKIAKLKSASEVFKAIASTKSVFASRADASGTNSKELALWKAAEITPEGDWYLKTGQGMGDTLRIASEKSGYTLTDRATFLSLKDTLDLEILFQGEKSLLNIYHVITVNPEILKNINYPGAKAFADWMVTADTQKIIATFGVEKYGQELFIADAGKKDDEVK